jgi:hypothetical protein
VPNWNYLTPWFEATIATHTSVAAVSALDNGHVLLERRKHDDVVVAPVTAPRVTAYDVDQILDDGDAGIICLISKEGHYDWDAREHAPALGSSVHTMKELMTALPNADPRPLVNNNVAYAVDVLGQHNRVREVNMICEGSMELVRFDMSPVVMAVEYEYEFTQEAVVRALKHHPGVDAILNSNPNGTPTASALAHAQQAGIGLFSLGEMMGALNFDGSAFRNYR